MNTILPYLKVTAKNTPLGIVLIALLALEILTGGYIGLQLGSQKSVEVIKTISEINGSAIDGGAAMTSVTEELCSKTAEPVVMWFFVLIAMSALLLANFIWALSTKKNIEWIPEVLYVGLALGIWAVLDSCTLAPWFPILLIKTSLLIFALYLYFFEKQRGA